MQLIPGALTLDGAFPEENRAVVRGEAESTHNPQGGRMET